MDYDVHKYDAGGYAAKNKAVLTLCEGGRVPLGLDPSSLLDEDVGSLVLVDQ